jgi:hypothetical protein
LFCIFLCGRIFGCNCVDAIKNWVEIWIIWSQING